MERASEGLRARKKRANRDAIAVAARALFADRGYDSVTVVEIAAAADVSEKTVFNHFATKEEIAFAGGEGRLDRVLADLAARPAGTPVIDVFRAATEAMIDGLAEADAEFLAVLRDSAVLRSRLTAGWEAESAALTAAIAAATRADAGDVVPAVVARTLSWTHRSILGHALAGGDPDHLREAASRAYDQLAAGLGAYGAG